MKRVTLNIILIIFFIFFIQGKGIAQKTDTIYHINGNVLTGDFKKMVSGVVTWKMDGMGTISLEEVKINSIKSNKQFEIKMDNGFIYFGSFDTSGVDRKVYILVANGKELINIDDIVEVYPIKRNFWMRTSGNFSLGLNYTKGSNVGTLDFSGNLNYRKERTYFNLSWDDNNTFQGDSLSSTKSDVAFSWQRTFKKKWSSEVGVDLTQNSELGTKLRVGLSVTGLRDISYNNWNRLYVGAGLNVSRETPYDDSGVTNDLAGMFNVVWKVYKYTIPKVWVDANIAYLPYITDKRHRINFNLNPSVSIFSDNFKVGVKLYYDYDSNPSSSSSSNNDYGINLQFTFTFH